MITAQLSKSFLQKGNDYLNHIFSKKFTLLYSLQEIKILDELLARIDYKINREKK